MRQLNIKQIFKNGFTDLLPIVEGEKRPAVPDWPNFIMSMERLEMAQQAGLQTFGIKAKYFPGVDIDVMAPGLAEGIRQLAIDILGVAPTRYGQRPKCLLMYRTNTPFKKFSLRFQSKADSSIKGAIEILGDGQQYILTGNHPSAGQYEWAQGEDIDLINSDELTIIDADQVKDFLTAVESKLNPAKWEVIDRRSGAETALTSDVDPESLLAPSLQAVRACVSRTPNQTDWDGFAEFGLAIYGATGGSTEGQEIFMEWALQWASGTADPADVNKLWRTATPRSGWNRVQWLARKFGTKYTANHAAQYDFETIEAPNFPKERDTTYGMADVISAQGISAYVVREKALNDLRFDPYEERWWRFVKGRWVTTTVSTKKGTTLCEESIKHLLADMEAWLIKQPEGANGENIKVLIRLRAKRTVSEVRAYLEIEASFWVRRKDFDDPDKTNHLLNTPTGTFNLKLGKMEPYDPDHLITKMTTISPMFDSSKHPLWTDMLNKVLQSDYEAISYLQRYLGSAMGGSTTGSKVLLVMLGESNSGKSTINETIVTHILGDYATVTAEGVLLQRIKSVNSQHPTGIAHILPVRFAALLEGTEDREWNASLVKSLTGGDSIAARKMNRDFETSRFYGKLSLSCNDLPLMDSLDSGMRQRLAIMYFTVIPEDENDLQAVSVIQQKEAPYIFGWLLSGWALEQNAPVAKFDNRPEEMQAATEAVFQDPMSAFIDQCLDIGGTKYTKSREICEAYNEFVEDDQVRTPKGFGMKFNRHPKIMGRRSMRTDGAHYNVTLKSQQWKDS